MVVNYWLVDMSTGLLYFILVSTLDLPVYCHAKFYGIWFGCLSCCDGWCAWMSDRRHFTGSLLGCCCCCCAARQRTARCALIAVSASPMSADSCSVLAERRRWRLIRRRELALNWHDVPQCRPRRVLLVKHRVQSSSQPPASACPSGKMLWFLLRLLICRSALNQRTHCNWTCLFVSSKIPGVESTDV